MKTAIQLVEEYNKRNQEGSLEKSLPLLNQIISILGEILAKELPAPVVEVIPSDVKVDTPVVNVNVPDFPEFPELKAPTVNIDSYDYTSILIELKRSVDKLQKTIAERPTRYKVERNDKNFISEVVGIRGE